MSKNLSKHLGEIKNLPLLKSLENKELEALLKNAKINSYKKDKTLFSSGEKIINFYIILSGSLKIFALNSEGEESILQIIGAKRSVFNIFSDIFQTNARAIEDCQILAIPLEKLRVLSKTNLSLMMNFLQEEAQKNSELLKQMTNLKLADADYKIGQFLIELAFEKGDKAKNIELKSSKATIASYLGIKPETLSRALNKLKKSGEIAVEKNQITLLKKDSLCRFCDSENAKKCSNLKSSFCVHN